MALMAQIIRRSGANLKDAASATSMIILTGVAMLNVTAVAFSGQRLGWLQWTTYMAVPGIFASFLMMTLHFLVFKQTGPFMIDRNILKEEQKVQGPLSRDEKVTIAWIVIALMLWVTDFVHHISILRGLPLP
jgi:di/tricarboxylate transporter